MQTKFIKGNILEVVSAHLMFYFGSYKNFLMFILPFLKSRISF